MAGKFYRINQYIRAPKLRVIDENGKQVGILTLSEALEKAKEKQVDLVEIAPTAQPPVAKIIDFKKFRYLEEKKERKAKRGIKGGEIKGIRLTPFIAQGDFDFRVRRAEEFLKEGNKVRVVVRFTRRQLGKKEFGYNLIKKFTEALSRFCQTEGEPKWLGKDLVLTFSPVKGLPADRQGGKNAKEKNENKKVDKSPV
ncbi:MAG: translation initiation factor IF-3 [Patescibacteria group bacterium]